MKQNRFILFSIVLLVSLAGCKQKAKKTTDEKLFPALSFIKSQVAGIDTSLYSIRLINIIDSTHSDTSFIPREQFRAAAKDFLELPDIAGADYEDRYKEEKMYEQSLDMVMLIAQPLDPTKEQIQRQEVLIKPNTGEGDKISTIIINSFSASKDSSVQKMLLWKADHSFQVIATKKWPGQQEKITTTKVIWNEEE